MRKQSIDETKLIEVGKTIIHTGGIEAINMRSIAEYCNISLGSIYNYYKDKDELLIAVVKSIWTEIAHDNALNFRDFKSSLSSLYYNIAKGNKTYPDFLKIHFVSFTNKEESKMEMNKIINHIKDSLLRSLENDKAVKDIFNESFTKIDFVDFIFENMMTLLLQNKEKDYLLKIIDILLYEN